MAKARKPQKKFLNDLETRAATSSGFTQDNDYDHHNRQKPSLILSFTAVYGV